MRSKKIIETEFAPLIIDGRFYIIHLLSDSFLYLHCDLYSHPDDVSPERYHHKIRMIKLEHDRNFQLVILKSNFDIHAVWILVLKAESWFRSSGICKFKHYLNY
ncbi:hypothetical protein SAMN05421821_101414 [Mucilaginibacter lappiensis]|uniref:Uncharacterized protein n=1 Tax=Mucilaginibacter lappiensis TaxID=354630 RepID=A0ABR6PEK4_9SPHI|nr:hypothetical protein [Mucilaginibacter lappiensis]SIQ01021.1 hypothetical protein SAMN05421821_101414 [Mucilaginibacter lappiensis]